MRVKTAVTVVMLIILVSPIFTETLGTRAGIEEKGDIWVLDKGFSNGVTRDLEGYLMKKTYSTKERKLVPERVAHFKVSKVFQSFCYAKVDKWSQGFTSKDARFAQFLKHLVPPKGTKKKPPAAKEKKVETGKTQRWYLEKGDNAYALKQYERAIDYYDKVLEKDPDDPGAKSRRKKARGRHFILQGDLDHENSEYSRAYEYYIMAFQVLGEENFLAAEKILDLWTQDKDFHERTKEFEINPAVILDSLINYCGELLEENQLDILSTLSRKMKQFAEDDGLKNKLETLTAAKEIQGDIENNSFQNLLVSINQAIEKNNLYKADYIIKRLDALAIDNRTKDQLVDLKEKLRAQQTQVLLQREVKQKEEKIRKYEEEAEAFVKIKKYDEAINRYMEIYKLEPDKKEYSEKITRLQSEKHKYEKFQEELKATVERDGHILRAADYLQKDLMQDALDYYIKAYKALPEEGKAVAGVVKVLETCSVDDAKFISPDLLGRKRSKFTKDFLNHVEKEYLAIDDEAGFDILSKIGFISGNKRYAELMTKIKDNLYAKNLRLGNDRFKAADFKGAGVFYEKAKGFKETAAMKIHLEVCVEMEKIAELVARDRKKELGLVFGALMTHPNKYDIVEGMLNLSDKYLDESNFKKAKYLYKKADGFQIYKFRERITALKKKAKGLKKK